MNFSALGSGNAMSSYLNSLLAKSQANGQAKDQGTVTAGVEAGSQGDKLMKAASDAALANAAKGVKAAAGQRQLESKATALAAELQAALRQAGVKLGGAVDFSVAANGQLAIKGTQKDADAANAFLKNDQRVPSFASRVAALAKEADAHSQTVRQNAAISQAARYAASASGVMSLYGSLLQRQDGSTAVFTLGASGGSLSYPGMLQSKA